VQATANDYRDVVNAAVASSPYGSTVLSSYDNVSNNAIFGAGSTNIAFKSTIDFGVGSGGTYSFRAGVDFGNGGAVPRRPVGRADYQRYVVGWQLQQHWRHLRGQ
jgi:hypothetical protein